MVTLYRVKPRFQALLRPLVSRAAATGVTANQVTAAAVAVSAAAGAAVATGATIALGLVPLLYLARMGLNAMDGLLAREHGMATDRGAVLNELGDVVSDAVAYLPFALLFPAHAAATVAVVTLGIISEVAALAGGGPRRNDGPLGKSDRAVAFGALAIAGALGLSGAGVVLWPLAALAALTIVNRTR